MARKPALSIDKLKDLDADKLAQLVLGEAERNASFRRQVKAALAGKSGPQAIAKLIDRRLSGLDRAKSFIEWDKARTFRDDLRSLIDTITSELGPAAPALAIDRLLRFIATHERVTYLQHSGIASPPIPIYHTYAYSWRQTWQEQA